MLAVGDSAPNFELKDGSGTLRTWKEFKGQRVVLYFYPKDMTPGCTKEACSFRDHKNVYKKKNISVIGVSPDSEKAHAKFSEKYELPFILLSDPDKVLAKAYGVWGKKKLYGREYEGILRTTFVISEKGKIETVFSKVKVDSHASDILETL